ncbi:MAG: type II secretion system secretin GspD, partial [Lysobacter sp.]|nr:type II secretion system secretin GspD [Lysobacter sp.]
MNQNPPTRQPLGLATSREAGQPRRSRSGAFLRSVGLGLLVALLASCASTPSPTVRRDGTFNPAAQAGTVARGTGGATRVAGGVQSEALEAEDTGPRPQIRRGTGQMINSQAASAAPPDLGGSSGAATFNFEGESLHAVVKAILGDMLGQNYVIAPGVQGTVTLATPKPVSSAGALSLLEMVLGWNNARMVYSGGRYNIVPADQALAGNVVPRTGSGASARGFEARTVPLRYISSSEMRKVLEPYARSNAIVAIDSARNTITVAGSGAELQNYLRTIEIFDVDWLSGMSVGVFPLKSGKATRVVSDLEKVFGEESKSPVAGMFRFMPLEGANAVMVITPQAEYLDDIQDWLERIDGAGDVPQLFSHELKYIRARELAETLSNVFGGSGGGGGDEGGAPSLMPGLEPVQFGSGQGSGGRSGGAGAGGGGRGGVGGGGGGGEMSLSQQQGGDTQVTLQVDGDRVGVSAVEETNTLLVRSTPRAWKSIQDVIEKLDVMPMQVHIEAQVVEVQLSGALEYGVNWFFERAVTDAGLPSAVGRNTWSTLAGSVLSANGDPPGLAWTFLGRNAAAVISALDEVTDLQLLQTPSVVVRNNAEATFNVGSNIPISSVTVSPGLGGDTVSQVQFLETGTILR